MMKEKRALKVVTFNQQLIAYELVTKWIQDNGHYHVLAVTSPGPKSRPSPSYQQVVEATPRNVDVLVTTRTKRVAEPLIRELQPDLIVCFSFAYRLSEELCKIPKYGAMNVHPAVLPSYRGPNIMRQFYDGAPEFGATAHWMAEEYDTGNILSQKSAPLPEYVTRETVLPLWVPLVLDTIAEGAEKAIAGDIGEKQDDSKATYAAPYSEEEHWLNWSEPKKVIQRKEMALNLLSPGSAKAKIGDENLIVTGLEILKAADSSQVVGKVVERNSDEAVIQVLDGLVRVTVQSVGE